VAVLAEIRRRARLVAGPVAGISLFAYFAYHLVEGERGLIAWRGLQDRIRVAEAERDAAHAERTALEERVSLLRPGHLDRDMLDERAREVLNRIGPDERVIFLNEPPPQTGN
jgi:cell division protein FtsB